MAQRCEATSKATGEQCARYAIEGAKTCRVHGSASPQSKAAARRRIAHQEAETFMRTLGRPVDITPTDALLEEVRWTAGHVRWLRERVQELDHDTTTGEHPIAGTTHPLVWGRTEEREKSGGDDWGNTTVDQAGPSIWYQLYQQERKHLIVACAAALKAGVEERRVRLAESEGQLVGQVIADSLNDILTALVRAGLQAHLQQQWHELVGEIVPRRLRALNGVAS